MKEKTGFKAILALRMFGFGLKESIFAVGSSLGVDYTKDALVASAVHNMYVSEKTMNIALAYARKGEIGEDCKCFKPQFKKVSAIKYCSEKWGVLELGGLKAIKALVESVRPSGVFSASDMVKVDELAAKAYLTNQLR